VAESSLNLTHLLRLFLVVVIACSPITRNLSRAACCCESCASTVASGSGGAGSGGAGSGGAGSGGDLGTRSCCSMQISAQQLASTSSIGCCCCNADNAQLARTTNCYHSVPTKCSSDMTCHCGCWDLTPPANTHTYHIHCPPEIPEAGIAVAKFIARFFPKSFTVVQVRSPDVSGRSLSSPARCSQFCRWRI